MHPQAQPTQQPALADQARVRCRALGLPTWVFDAAGRLVAEPTEEGLVGGWLRSGAVREAVLAAVRARNDRAWASREVIPGFHLVAMEDRLGRRLRGTLFACALGPEIFQSAEFASLCESMRADADAVRRAMEPLASFPSRGIDRVCTLLGWMRDDLAQAGRDKASLAEHAVQLTEMYEEIGLLYRLGKTMNHLTAPAAFVRNSCDELAATLPFSWIAVRFARTARVAPDLAGTLTLAGRPPVPRPELERETGAVLGGLTASRWKLLPDGEGSSIAAACGSQVLAHPIARGEEVVGALLAGNKSGPDPEISGYETQLLDAAAAYLGVFTDNASLYAEQTAMFLGTVGALTAAIDAKDHYTRGHSERVAYLAHQLALANGLEPAGAERVHLAGLLHDVGKIGVPESVLCKPGRLEKHEFDLIKQHPTIGHRILRDIPGMDDVLPGVLHHHERWDGGGYPAGLAGDAIAPIARILAVADSFDAMSSNRSYRSAMPRAQVLTEVARCAGTQFDPALAHRFVSLDFSVYDTMVERHRNVLSSAA